MTIKIYSKEDQAYGAFNGGEIIENKPLGFPQDGGELRPYSNIFYWANAVAKKDSTIGLHPHQGFEILSFVLEGRIRHYDTKMDEWKWLSAGDVQVIQSGSGISHAEHMESGGRMFQIWVDPNLNQTLNKDARYSDFTADMFEAEKHDGYEETKYTGSADKLVLDAESVDFGRVKIYGNPYRFPLDAKCIYSIYVLNGSLRIEGKQVNEHDFILIADGNDELPISGEGEFFYIISPKKPSYSTYAELIQERMRR
jgi:redox-sensitive bicupin YhaK (pirin superfamily)